MGSVEEQFQTVARSNLSESLDVAGVSPNVYANDARRPWRDHLLDSLGIKGMGARIDIAKNRRDPLPLNGVGRGDKSEGWNDDLALQPQGANRDLQSHRTIAHRNTVFHANQVGDSLLELFYERTIVGKPARVEYPVEAFEQSGAVADVGPAYVQSLFKCRLTSKKRQVGNRRFR